MKIITVLVALAAMTVSLRASTINFAGGGSLGTSQTYGPVTAAGYLSNNNPGTLYGKGHAGGKGNEDGLGLRADPTGEHEIFAGTDFIQLGISGLSGIIQISMGSTGGDSWAVFGSNTAGTLGTTMLASGDNDDGHEVTLTNATTWKYLDIKAVTNNVLLQDLTYTANASVPEPGTLGIVGLGGVLIALLRRKVCRNSV